MSEKPIEREIRSKGAHPDMKPESPVGLDGVHPIKVRKGRRPLMSGAGLFDDQVESGLPSKEPPVFYGPEKPHLERWFKKGTILYSLDFPVPRTVQEAGNRAAGVLEEAMPLGINMENLVWSEKLGRWREKPKGEHKTKLFGAFVIVDMPAVDREGKQITVKKFASLNDLQKQEDNDFARFKKATSR